MRTSVHNPPVDSPSDYKKIIKITEKVSECVVYISQRVKYSSVTFFAVIISEKKLFGNFLLAESVDISDTRLERETR